MKTLTFTLWVVLVISATFAVPIKDVDEGSELSREKRSPGGWHSPPPEGVWKKKLVWKEDWKKVLKAEKKLIWKPEWRTFETVAYKKVWKPVWQKVWVPIHHEHQEQHGWD